MDALSLGTGFFLGLRHGLEPDHVTAVAQFASADPRPGRGLAFGLRWGAGHAAAVLLLGGAVLALGVRIGGRFERGAEMAVGATLIALALWRLRDLMRVEHAHVHKHVDGVVHAHPHTHGLGHLHGHGATLTGLVHGTAGSLGVLALLPLGGSTAAGLATIGAFSVGTLLSMGLFGLLAGRLYAASARSRRALAGATALFGLGLGMLWIGRQLAS